MVVAEIYGRVWAVLAGVVASALRNFLSPKRGGIRKLLILPCGRHK